MKTLSPINAGWTPELRNPGANLRTDALRLLIVNAVLRGKLAKSDIEQANELIAGHPIAVYTKLARQFADRVAESSDVKADELLAMLSSGPAAALYKLASDRRAAQQAFEQTDYSKRLRDLTAKRDAALAAWRAVERNEDVSREKKWRLRGEHEASLAPLNALVNSRDPELVAFRNLMKETADPTLNELKWENFAI